MGHMFESWINVNATDFSRMFVREGLRAWEMTKDVLLGRKKPDQEDYDRMLYASCCAGMAIAHTGTAIPHGLSYILTYDLHMPHGAAIGYFQEGYLREADEKDRSALLYLAGFGSLEDLHVFYEAVCGNWEIPDEVMNRTFECIASQPKRLAVPTFRCSREALHRIAFGQ